METMILIYKERSDWKGWMKNFISVLKAIGYDVEEKTFPAITMRNQIESWLKDNEAILLKKQYVITDSYCRLIYKPENCVLMNEALDSMPRYLGGFGIGIDVSALLHILDRAKNFGGGD